VTIGVTTSLFPDIPPLDLRSGATVTVAGLLETDYVGVMIHDSDTPSAMISPYAIINIGGDGFRIRMANISAATVTGDSWTFTYLWTR
jgi:hypothetical protein